MHVTVKVGAQVIEAVITRRSAEDVHLKEGDAVTAVVKATEVMPCEAVASCAFEWSWRPDSNQRRSGPEPSARRERSEIL